MSSILTPQYFQQIETITKSSVYSMCYKSSSDGLSPKAFHDKCDGLSPTVTIILSKAKGVFGGFTYATWDGTELKEDPKAVLFSLKQDKIFEIKKGMPAINTSPLYLPRFGKEDIVISEKDSYTRFNLRQHTMTDKFDDSLEDSETKNYFDIEEIEVYHMKEKEV